jgi:hypothetical protein
MGTPDTTPQDKAAHLNKKVNNLSKKKHNTSDTTPHDSAAYLTKKLKKISKKHDTLSTTRTTGQSITKHIYGEKNHRCIQNRTTQRPN